MHHPGQAKERSVLISLLIDFVLLIPDIVAAVMANSITLWADVIKCSNELLSTFLSWLTLRMVVRGKKTRYDYGLGKLENVTGMAVAGAMLLSLLIVVFSAVERLLHPEEMHAGGVWLALVLMTAGVIANTSLWIKNYRVSRRQFSPIMEAQWRLFRAKAFSDALVLLALILSVTLKRYHWAIYIDPVASFAIAGFLLASMWSMVPSSFNDLLDCTLDETMQLVIVKHLAAHFHEYKALHGVRSRRSGSTIFVEILLEFDGHKKMAEVQAAINRLQADLEHHMPGSRVLIAPTNQPLRSETPA